MIVELMNFDKYKLLIDQFSQGASKSKRDLTEMRFFQAFEESMCELESLVKATVTIVITCEKLSDLQEVLLKTIRSRVNIPFPERDDREIIIKWVLLHELEFNNDYISGLNVVEISKYL